MIRLLPLDFVIFAGFFGYSLLITVFTPMLLQDGGGGLLPAGVTMPTRTLTLGILLCLYPAGQFFGSPVLGARSPTAMAAGRSCWFRSGSPPPATR